MVGAGFSKFADLASNDGRSPPLWSDFETEMRKRLHGESLPNDPLKLAEQYNAALGRHALDALRPSPGCRNTAHLPAEERSEGTAEVSPPQS
jgi:hypothetical protein